VLLQSINAALHNAHCSHAGSTLFGPGVQFYLRIIRTKDRKEREMNLIRNYRNWRRYRETVSELGRLSNRGLTDLGIARTDIRDVARKAI
jgi:uncharacterized protein YjiS (DUF1127 family)